MVLWLNKATNSLAESEEGAGDGGGELSRVLKVKKILLQSPRIGVGEGWVSDGVWLGRGQTRRAWICNGIYQQALLFRCLSESTAKDGAWSKTGLRESRASQSRRSHKWVVEFLYNLCQNSCQDCCEQVAEVIDWRLMEGCMWQLEEMSLSTQYHLRLHLMTIIPNLVILVYFIWMWSDWFNVISLWGHIMQIAKHTCIWNFNVMKIEIKRFKFKFSRCFA